MALWQLLNLGTGCTVTHCEDCIIYIYISNALVTILLISSCMHIEFSRGSQRSFMISLDIHCEDYIQLMFTNEWWYENCGHFVPDEMNVKTDVIQQLLEVTFKAPKSVTGRRFSITFELFDKLYTGK